MAELTEIAPKILPYMDVTWELLDRERRAGKRILFEGAQGALLDIDHGTYPFVTSSNTVAAQAAIGSGVGPGAIGYVLGIAKAYTTRVGAGPFPTELTDAIGERWASVAMSSAWSRAASAAAAGSMPASCGRPIKVTGINGIALTKLDVLDGFETLQVCVGYHLDGERIGRLPAGHNAQARLKPIYESFEGWTQSTRGARSWTELAGAGGEIRAHHRGADRVPGDAAVDQPRARRHDPDARSVPGLSDAGDAHHRRGGRTRRRRRRRKSAERTRYQLGRQQPAGIDRARQRDLAERDAAEAEFAVVGLVADQHDQGDAGAARVLQRVARPGRGRGPGWRRPGRQPAVRAAAPRPCRRSTIGVKRTAATRRPSIRHTRQNGENSPVPSRMR